MDELLFTADDLKRYKDNSYLFDEPFASVDQQKTDAIRQYLKNQRAINWLEHGYYDESCQEKDNYYSGLTIAAALEWYEKYQEYWADSNSSELQLPQQETKNYWLRRNNSTEIGVEIVDNEPEDTTDWKKIVGAVKSDDPIPRAKLAKIIRKNPASIKTILVYHPNFDKAVEALLSWNRLMPTLISYDGVEKREQSKPCQTAEVVTDKRKKLDDELFEKEILPQIFEKLEYNKYQTNIKTLYEQIAEPYTFGGDAIRKRFDKNYRPNPDKLHEALRKYGNERLIEKIKNLR